MTTPAWNIDSEYRSLEAPEFMADLEAVQAAGTAIRERLAKVRPLMETAKLSPAQQDQLLAIFVQNWEDYEKAGVLLWDLFTYANCRLTVDVTDEKAESALSRLQMLYTVFSQASQPQVLFLMRTTEDFYQSFVGSPAVAPSRFFWDQKRLEKDLLLSENEEALLLSLRMSGHQAWGDLYNKLAGTLRCEVHHDDGKTEIVGLAQAQAMTKMADEKLRRAAWKAIQAAWTGQKETSAAILNALAGWRLETVKKRSHTRPHDFLEAPLRENRIERRTLDAMMKAIELSAPQIREGAKAMARLQGKERLDPWDLLAPAPVKGKAGAAKSFEEGLATVRQSFAGVSTEFGDFVQLMADRQWIESRILPNKQGGAYCTFFHKSKTPRVFQTYMGSFSDISTLAHELGHAYHSWVMRDLPQSQTNYPMTLAETASIFAETVLINDALAACQNDDEKLTALYAEVENAFSLLINIPSRFEFEKNFYTQRQKGVVSADELSALMDQAWTRWYGDSLTENDKMFWASKMHFSFADVSFYNFPYAFGYLFSLSIYARRRELGADFMPKVVGILRDTGRMTAEELVQTHLGEDLGDVAFWQKSLSPVLEKIEQFGQLVARKR